jgi:hypothetical protein
MRGFDRTAATMLAVLALSGCSLLRGKRDAASASSGRRTVTESRGEVKAVSTKVPRAEELAKSYGCKSEVVAANLKRRSATPAKVGAPMCSVLGIYGDPISVSSTKVADMQLVSMLHRPDTRYVSVTYVYYADTKVNRKLGRPVGAWLVQRFSVSR